MTGLSPMTDFAMVFPGQGSQKAGMLQALAAEFSLIPQTFAQASQAVGFDLWQIAQGQPDDSQLNQTAYTQPVLLTASVSLWRLWLAQAGPQPQALAGHSLGEYSALVCAEALSLEDAVRLVHRRGQLMQQAVPAGQGSMAAILGLDDQAVIALCEQTAADSGQVVNAANFNAPGQVVIAGEAQAVQQAMAGARAQGGKAMPIPVSVPSHCTLMAGAADELARLIDQISWRMPAIPVWHNVHAQPATDIPVLKQALIDQLAQPVRWTQTLQAFAAQGLDTVVECGAGNVLTNLAKRAEPALTGWPTDTPERLQAALTALKV